MPAPLSDRAKGKLENVTSLEKFEKELTDRLQSITDETTLVLKAHLYIEQVSKSILASFFTHADAGSIVESMSFHDMLQILRASNIIDDYLIESLKKLNSIRNKLSHDANYSTIRDVLKLERKGEDTFKKVCRNLKVGNVEKASIRTNFTGWVCKLYAQMHKCKLIAQSAKKFILTEKFIDEVGVIDLQ